MFIPLCFLAALIAGSALQAQTQTPPAEAPKPAQAPTPAPAATPVVKPAGGARSQVRDTRAYVRRFSIGATLSVLALPMIKAGAISKVTTAPAFDGVYDTTATNHRIGFGVTGQIAITERFAVSAGIVVRRIAYMMNSDIFEGVDNPTTLADERKHTAHNEDTRARLYDLPVTVRFYGKDRHDKGPRWFVEGGAAVRRVSNIKSSIDTTIGTAATTCCNTTPVTPANRNLRGFVGGFGVQLIDPLGIRVVPGVRYTRWMGETFNSNSTLTQHNQLEGGISLTF